MSMAIQSERIELAKRIFAEFAGGRGSTRLLVDSAADDVVLRLTIQPGTPMSGDWRGKDGLATYLSLLDEVVRSDDHIETDYLAGGDKVVVLGRERLTVTRTGTAAPPSDWATVFTFRGLEISEILVIEDTAPITMAYLDQSPES